MVYKIRKDNVSNEGTYQRHDIYNGKQCIGWLMVSDNDYVPLLMVTAKNHNLDRHALAVEVKKIDPNSWGSFFLVTELVSFEDLAEPAAEEAPEIVESEQTEASN